MTSEPDPREAEFQAQLEALRVHFRGELPARRAALMDAWAGCADGGDEDPWLRLRDVAHKLSGSAPNFGFEAVGGRARALDRLVSGRMPCRERAGVAAEVASLVAELDAAIGRG